ncbi:aldo/keto reductase [Clostridium sp. CTA-19]
MGIDGYATLEGTKMYFNKMSVDNSILRRTPWFYTLPMAIGTYLGETKEVHSELYVDSIIYGLSHGVNYVDTAAIYREMRSEKDIGKALEYLINEKRLIKRKEIVISSKAGIIDNNYDLGISCSDYINNIILKEPSIKRENQIIEENQAIYSIDSALHEFSLKNSMENLKVSTIDIMYIHNPELSMSILKEKEFYNQLQELFKFYEQQVKNGRIRFYGMATWYAFRVEENNPMHISLEKVVSLAKKVGGEGHHFKFIQMPYNIKNTEASTSKTQKVNNRYVTPIEAANRLDLFVTISAPLNQCKDFDNSEFNYKKLIDYVINTKGVYAAMIGSKRRENLIKNMDAIL